MMAIKNTYALMAIGVVVAAIFVLGVMGPVEVQAAYTYGNSGTGILRSDYFPGLTIGPLEQYVNGSTNSLGVFIKNTTGVNRTVTIKKAVCRCQKAIGEPYRTGTGQCQFYWTPGLPLAACQTTTEQVTLRPYEKKLLTSHVSQSTNQRCGSFQLDFKLNGTGFAASFANMVNNCPDAPTDIPAILTASCTASPNPANLNEQVTFNASRSGGNGSYTYSWSGACTGTNQNCSNSFSQGGTKTALLTVTSGSQTVNTSCQANVNQANPLVVSCTASPNPANLNEQVTFNASRSGGNGSYTYSWSGACTGTNQNCSNSFSTSGLKTATIIVTSGNQTQTADCTVGVNQPPALTATCTASPNPANINQAVNFNGVASGGIGNYTYSWTGACSAFGQNCSNSFSQGGIKTAFLTVTSGSQTVNTSCQTNVNQTDSLTVSCDASPNPANINQSVTFTPTFSGGTGGYSFNWRGHCAGTAQNCTTTFSTYGQKSATVDVTSGGQTRSATCYVQVNQIDDLSVSCSASPNPVQINHQVAFNAYASGGTGNYNYTWSGACNGYSQTCYNMFGQANNSYTANVTVTSGGQSASTSCTVSTNQSATNLVLTKRVRNLSSGNLTWASSVGAAPSDIVQFQVTVQANANQTANNVMVRDILPANLIYRDALTVDGIATIGSVTGGFNIGSIAVGQTRTITYQAQVAPAQNFAFGSTTLTNLVNASTTGSGYNTSNTASAAVIVTRTGVQGATNVSTGLTNNPWVDSFFLPLVLALIGLWLYKSKVVAMPSWVGSMQTKNRTASASRNLESRIAQIRSQEKLS